MEQQLARQRVLDAHQRHPQWASGRLHRHLSVLPDFTMSVRTVRRVIQKQSRTVQTHGGHNRAPQEVRQRIFRLLYGTEPIINGLRSNRYSVSAATDLINYDEKENIISERSVRRIGEQMGLVWRVRRRGPAVTDRNRQQRREFRRRHRNRTRAFWRRVVWSDSVPLTGNHTPNRHNDGVWVRPGDRVPATQRHRPPPVLLHVYGVLTSVGLVGPFFITGSINARTYLSILRQMLAGVSRLFGHDDWLWQQDGAPAHKANTVQAFLRSHHSSFIPKDEWPGNSPDLSPVEQVWPLLSNFCQRPGERNIPIPQLKERAGEFFRNFKASDCLKLCQSMPKRLRMLEDYDYWSIPQ